jgi:hypothetical protein
VNPRELVNAHLQQRRGHKFTNMLASKQLLDLASIHLDTTAPESVTQWLTDLTALGGVPLDYLVPDERMLPHESFRFFQVDPNWIYSLLEGAYSVGRVTSSDQAHDDVNARSLYGRVAPGLYSHIHEKASGGAAPFHYSGFLLRSALVSGWPGLRVKAYGKDGKELTLAPGESESGRRLTPDILFYLVEGIIAKVTLQEPNEGLHFGLDKTGDDHIAPTKSLRKLTGPDLGGKADKAVEVKPEAFRPSSAGKDYQVLKIDTLARKMPVALGESNATFTPAEFALEMIEGVEGVMIQISQAGG